jgi:hypothetical protein
MLPEVSVGVRRLPSASFRALRFITPFPRFPSAVLRHVLSVQFKFLQKVAKVAKQKSADAENSGLGRNTSQN